MFKAAVPKVGDRPPEGAAAITQGRSGAFYLIFCISATVGKVNSHCSALNKFREVLKWQLLMCPGRGSRGRYRKRDLRETCFSSFFNFLHFFFGIWVQQGESMKRQVQMVQKQRAGVSAPNGTLFSSCINKTVWFPAPKWTCQPMCPAHCVWDV